MAAPTGVTVGSRVWVNVAVATLWTSPTAPRPVDDKAISSPVDIPGWLSAMSVEARRGLVGRVETQALYGDKLVVTAIRGPWLHVVTPGQPTHRDPRGYPGWLPVRQVTQRAPASTPSTATVVRPTTWLRSQTGARVIQLSFGTRLPVASVRNTGITVMTPERGRLIARAAAVVVRPRGRAALPASASAVLTSARSFLRRPYLWGGRSGFAVDCSGLTSLVYAVHGIVIPRDTDDQASTGRAVALNKLQPADLVLFGDGGTMSHVGMVVRTGQMLHAPHTGAVVQIGPIGTPARARRLL